MSELRALLDEPGVQHLLPPNWKDRVLAAVEAAERVSKVNGDCSDRNYDKAERERLRAERAEADLAQSESTLAGLRRVHAETVERYQRAEADLADEKRRHGDEFERGIRQAIEWLRADYEYGTGPDWREQGAEWIAERAAEMRTNPPPDFTQLALESPYARDEWQQAWNLLATEEFTAAWSTLLGIVRSSWGSPTETAQHLLKARDLPLHTMTEPYQTPRIGTEKYRGKS